VSRPEEGIAVTDSMFVGGSLDQMEALARTLKDCAEIVVPELQSKMQAAVDETAWMGPAADQFRANWADTFSPMLTNLQTELMTNSGIVSTRLEDLRAAGT